MNASGGTSARFSSIGSFPIDCTVLAYQTVIKAATSVGRRRCLYTAKYQSSELNSSARDNQCCTVISTITFRINRVATRSDNTRTPGSSNAIGRAVAITSAASDPRTTPPPEREEGEPT